MISHWLLLSNWLPSVQTPAAAITERPLALDLVNTAWPDGEGWRDVLANRSGHEEWLRDNDLPGPSTAAARRALLQVRSRASGGCRGSPFAVSSGCSTSTQRVGKCANPDCPFWCLDTTRSGTRRWCSMTVCGNRLKARRHYRRQHHG
jgi:hypothetical protein